MKTGKIFYLALILFITTINSQTINVSGNISTPDSVVKNARITFIDASDTSKSYTALTDSMGNYNIGLVTSIGENETEIPEYFHLGQNYPNPFANETVINYNLNKQADVSVTIYDILGREVKKFSIGEQNAGIHGIIWDGKNNFGQMVTTGIYFYRLQSGEKSQVNKMIFNKGGNNLNPLQISNLSFKKTNLGKKSEVKDNAYFNIKVKSDTNTTPLIVISEYLNQKIEGDTTLNFKVEEAKIIFGQSIEGIKLGDDSATVIDKLGLPEQIQTGDFGGFIFIYLLPDSSNRIKVTFMEEYDSRVTAITVHEYKGKTKDGIGIGSYRNDVLKIMGTPSSTYSEDSIADNYILNPLSGFMNSQIYIFYNIDEVLISLIMMIYN
ncbi:MAG: T9SS type A sorting domain-containing protein [Ignavibacteria bacterium]|nr:T9SS type A sorting domain-containing protein [Ignavibacteria bacterium]